LVCVGWRPLFKEHVNRAGQKIGQRELSRINDRCNERVVDTGDFSPLAVGHTRDDASVNPEVIGFIGPYRMGRVGKLKPMHAIEGKVWVYREQLHKLKQYPRLSVEFWADADDPGNGYFDPISLLGAETPELDLGVHYSKSHEGARLMRYSRVERFQASMPGGANTYVPSLVESDREKKTTYGESGSMLSAADIQQIVAAMDNVIDQKIDAAMASMKSAMGGGDSDLGGEGDLDGLGLEDDPDLDVGAGLGLDDEDDIAGEEQPDENGDDNDLDDDEMPEIDDELPSDETEQPGGDVPAVDKESSSPSGKDEGKTMANPAKKTPDDEKLTKENYAKEHRELREKYEKQTIELRETKENVATLKARVDASEAKEKRAVRYAKLSELQNSGYIFTIDEELADTAPLNDEQFERHCTKIVERYQRAPIGQGLYIPPSEKRDGISRDEKVERYSKVAGDVAKELVARGQKVDYAAIRANVERNDGKYVPEGK
jgi:hypothetical protein